MTACNSITFMGLYYPEIRYNINANSVYSNAFLYSVITGIIVHTYYYYPYA